MKNSNSLSISSQRAMSLDALRGYAILTMILSGQILLTHMPAWMAHAQVPPGKGFDPTIYGITWVDLVFPFFLFAMGAAFPFSIGTKILKKENKIKLSWDALVRAAQLVFFALFFQHMKPFVISNTETSFSSLTSLFAFGLMSLLFVTFSLPFLKTNKQLIWGNRILKIIAFSSGILLLNSISYTGKASPDFDLYFSDIILIVLANMALFGSIIYIFTYQKPIYRIAVLPFIMAIFLSSTTEGWVKQLYNYTPIPWAYSFYYLKYLFIVIPGSIAGEYLYEWINTKPAQEELNTNLKKIYAIAIASFLLIVANVSFLYTRLLEINLLFSLVLLSSIYLLIKNETSSYGILWKRFFIAGAYCLILGLFLEAYEGGIRKDQSTYSYYFVTSGLAFFTLLLFSILCDYLKFKKGTSFLVIAGKNPMVAYVSTSLIIMPLLTLLGLSTYFNVFNDSSFMGFLRGILFTTLAFLITIFFSKIKWFWRT